MTLISHLLALPIGMPFLPLLTRDGVFSLSWLSEKTTLVVCPTAGLPAEIKLYAAPGMKSCSRWPESADCRHTCTSQIQFSLTACRAFVAIYGGEACASCGHVLTAQDWYNNRLARLLSSGDRPKPSTFSLAGPIKPEDKQSPVCFVCYSAKDK